MENVEKQLEQKLGRVAAAKPGRVAADATAEISAETAALIVGSNEDLVS